jgi:hypothetical protein
MTQHTTPDFINQIKFYQYYLAITFQAEGEPYRGGRRFLRCLQGVSATGEKPYMH